MYKIKYGYDTPVNRSLALTGIIAHPAGKNYGSVRLLSSGSTSVQVRKMGNIKLEYSTDNVIFADVTWTGKEEASVSPTFSLQDGESLYLKGNNTCGVSDLFGFSFSGVGTIAATGDIRAISTNSFCYSMFEGCTSLTTAPALPATTLANDCYYGMFSGCTSLTTAPALPATTLANDCYYGMFDGCTNLTTAPALPATTLAEHCYDGMFDGCTSLTTAPALPATTLADYCYNGMFSGCEKISSLAVYFTAFDQPLLCTTGWLEGVSTTGTFHCPSSLDTTTRDASHVPEGWIISNN